jgi:hypothetical protein
MHLVSTLVAPLHTKLTFCGHVGAIVGALVGLFFGLAQAEQDGSDLSFGQLLAIGGITGGISWAIILLVVGIWLRYGARAIALPSLVTSLVTSFLTVLFNDLVDEPSVASLIGLAVGVVVGALLCFICRPLTDYWDCLKRTTDRGHG